MQAVQKRPWTVLKFQIEFEKMLLSSVITEQQFI